MYHRQRDFTLPAEHQAELRKFRPGFFPYGNAGGAGNRRGFFIRLLNALHESRRLQAARVIRQHRHLVAKPPHSEAANKILKTQNFIAGNPDMANSDTSRGQRPYKSLSPKAWMLIAIIGFAALHLVGGLLLFHASSSRSTETSSAEMHRD